MKKIATRALLWILSVLAQATISRYHPRIVVITGSVGKTTAKEMIAHLLSEKFRVGKNKNNVNTDWGITATIIDPNFSPLMTSDGWAKITLSKAIELIGLGLKNIFLQIDDYPDVLVLELAVWEPGSMHWFTRWLRYDVAVITSIGHVHQEFFEDFEHLRQEKLTIIDGLKHNGLLIVNENLKDVVEEKQIARTQYFAQPDYNYNNGMAKYSFSTQAGVINVEGNQTRPIALSAPIASMVASEFGMDVSKIKDKLSTFKSLSKRFDVHNVSRHITLINDAYNANPDSMKAAILGMQDIAGSNEKQSSAKPVRRRVAILGKMRELGDASRDAHLELGKFLVSKVDLLIVVGESGELIAKGAQNHGMAKDNIKILNWPREYEIADGKNGSVDDFYSLLVDNDVVLVKSSKTIGLNKLAESLLNKLS